MKVISTNIARPREIIWNGTPEMTGIYKVPVDALTIRKYFVEGDTVSDLQVHGGEDKAVYGYPSEHYPFWRHEFPNMEMPWGMFGENLTTAGLIEDKIMIGSVYRIGSALLEVTQPRMPCYKLAAKFETAGMIRRFLKSRKSGFYFKVLEEGTVRPGDTISLEKDGETGFTIVDVVKSRDRYEIADDFEGI